jgi:hypothetical protein
MTEAAGLAPIIVTALLGDADFAFFDGLRRTHFPPARNQLSAHLTMFHHLPPSLAPELADRLRAATRGIAPPQARIVGLLNLGGGVAFRIDSPGLAAIRSDLAQAFAGLLTPQDAGGWRAHVTVQNKVPAHVARETYSALGEGFTPRPLMLAGLASYFYRGGPWEPIGRYRFG